MPLCTSYELQTFRTADGSFTLRDDRNDVFYHSVHGAVQESVHVFIRAGLDEVIALNKAKDQLRPIDVIEVGLGSGLNFLLTWIHCLEGKCTVNYTALEPFPVAREVLMQLAYWEELSWPGLREPYLEVMGTYGLNSRLKNDLTFIQHQRLVQELEEENAFDLIYFDAFGPRTQPELWTVAIFERMYRALKKDGILVTYCAKGQVRRNMMAAGLQAERIPGPPGKRHMLRCRKTFWSGGIPAK